MRAARDEAVRAQREVEEQLTAEQSANADLQVGYRGSTQSFFVVSFLFLYFRDVNFSYLLWFQILFHFRASENDCHVFVHMRCCYR